MSESTDKMLRIILSFIIGSTIIGIPIVILIWIIGYKKFKKKVKQMDNEYDEFVKQSEERHEAKKKEMDENYKQWVKDRDDWFKQEFEKKRKKNSKMKNFKNN